MPNLNQAIQMVAKEAINAQKPTCLVFGKVATTSPVTVKLDNDLTLTSKFLIVPEHLTEKKITIGDTDYTVRESLAIGDKVAMIRNAGGQSYYILDRVV